MDLKSLSKEGRGCILMMELKKFLWECLIPSELRWNLLLLKNNSIKEEKTCWYVTEEFNFFWKGNLKLYMF